MSKVYQRPSGAYAGSANVPYRDKYQQDAGQQPRVAISSAKIDGDFNYIIDALNEMGIASGAMPTINDRSSVSLNEDGSIKASATMVLDDWVRFDGDVTKESDTSISVYGDHTAIFKADRKLRLIVNTAPVFAYVETAVYDGEKTILQLAYMTNELGVSQIVSTSPTSLAYSSVQSNYSGNSPSVINGLVSKGDVLLEDDLGHTFSLSVGSDALVIRKNTGTKESPVWVESARFDEAGLEIKDGAISFVKLNASSLATQAEAEAGRSSNKLMTPARTKQAIEALSGGRPVGFKAKLSAPQSAATVAETKLAFNSVVFDTNSGFDAVNARFKPTVAGTYLVTLKTSFTGGVTAHRAELFKNGVIVDNSSHSNVKTSVLTTMVEMNGTTDYLEGYVYQASGSSATLLALANGGIATSFEAVKVM